MPYTRPMEPEKFDLTQQMEFEALNKQVAEMRAEIALDPEGCFGGRGNNIGSVMLANAEADLAQRNSQGYSRVGRTYYKLIQAGIRFSAVTGVGHVQSGVNAGRVSIACRPGRGRPTDCGVEGNWIIGKHDIPDDIFAEAKAILALAPDGFKMPRISVEE